MRESMLNQSIEPSQTNFSHWQITHGFCGYFHCFTGFFFFWFILLVSMGAELFYIKLLLFPGML